MQSTNSTQKYPENILVKENLMMKKEIQAREEFNIAIEKKKISYRILSQTTIGVESKLNER